MPTINIYDVIIVCTSEKCGYPFNLKFKSTIKDERANGPGVYLISFKGKPIYFGKYQPYKRGNIFTDRWLKHMQTITLRGEQVGFGTNSTFEKVLPTVCDDLKIILRNLSRGELLGRFKDTGTCTSRQRQLFASQNWSQLSKATADDILDDFDFRYYKVGNIQDAEQAKKETSYIERTIINQFRLAINRSKGYMEPKCIDCIEARVFELIKKHGLEGKLELHLAAIK